MAVCDMCNASIPRGTGFLVPGKSTTTSFKKEVGGILSMMGLDEDRISSAVNETAAQMEGSPSLVCEGCTRKLSLSESEKEDARRKATDWWRNH